MDKEAKALIDYDRRKPTVFHNNSLKFYSTTSVIMPNNAKPKESTLWHMRHRPYQV